MRGDRDRTPGNRPARLHRRRDPSESGSCPSPEWHSHTITRTDESAGIRVVAEWRSGWLDGPGKVTIEVLPDAAPDMLTRGATTGTLGRDQTMMSGVLSDWREHLDEGEEHDRWIDFDAQLEEIVQGMPSDPRAGDDYYTKLLAAYGTIKASGHPKPPQVLEHALGITSRNTLNTRLRTARRRAADAAAESP